MFPFLTVFIIFLLTLAYFLRKNAKDQKEAEERFWNREHEANFARRKDISNLEYITIPLEKLPMDLHTEAEQKLKELSSATILNLTGYSNTDLKLEYGPANLEALTEYDNHFTELVHVLPVYAQELLDADHPESARALLEFGVSIHADAGSVYTMLADLYQKAGETDRIPELIRSAEELRSISKNAIVGKLKAYLPDLP